MSKPVILFNQKALEYIQNLSQVLTTQQIANEIYPELSMQLIYKQVERAKLLKENPTESLKAFLFPPWLDNPDNCITKIYDIPVEKHYKYTNIFVQPAKDWVLVRGSFVHSGCWYPKGTKRSKLK